ncbi:MAG TPA: DNA repair protein RecN [Lachnospiraceae bacterium]|nr:DNA repair protein RecN [Lachnospiraceae bacterium]
MLESLHVKNLALIDESEVVFKNGLNILTGETGAGKSIIIGSINLALGSKADKEMIRTGADYALIELVFSGLRKDQTEAIRVMEIPMEEDGTLILQRRISSTRSVCKVCGELVSAKQLKDLSEILIDIHGQHDNQTLLNKKKHLEVLDQYAGQELTNIKDKIKEQYQHYREAVQELEDSQWDETERNREISLRTFECTEIENANLKENEDTTLETMYKRMVNGKKIMEGISIVYRLTGNETGEGAGNTTGRALKEIRSISLMDESTSRFVEELTTIEDLLNDFNRSLAEYMLELEFDESDFYTTEERLNTINHMKSKYGNTIKEILCYQELQTKRLEQLLDYENYKETLEKKVTLLEEQLSNSCEVASAIRSKTAVILQRQLRDSLLELSFIDVSFEIIVTKNTNKYSSIGFDDVEFMISTNPGEPVKPLSHVASGGELSRIMLALKTILAEAEFHKTLIFDEIDAGISGRTAWQVSQKLGLLGKSHQIICITHLPQIAAMADSHFIIEKNTKNKVTTTSISEIKEEVIIEELSRLLGSDTVTDIVRSNAKEMKDLAIKSKQS